MKLLISAFSCQPNSGSEPGIGWGVVREAARRHSVWVLTDSHNRPGIERELGENGLPGAHFVYVALPPGFQKLAAVRWRGYVYYLLWQIRAYRVARRLHRRRRFDLVHHVSYGNSWAPSFMGFLGLPFIWCAGARETTPWRFLRALSWRGRASEAVRNLAAAVLGTVTLRLTATRASIILTPSDAGLWGGLRTTAQFPLGGLNLSDAARLRSLPERRERPFRVVSIGRLVAWKGFGLGLMAFAAVHKDLPESEYWIVGDGPERPALEKLARRLGCASQVQFRRWLPRDRVPETLAQVDVLVHPSLHEQFGYVVLEAMAAGRPVVCLRAGGCGRLVSGGGGIAIPVSTPERVVRELHQVLLEMARDPEKRFDMGRLARARALGQWSWERVGERLARLYESASPLRKQLS